MYKLFVLAALFAVAAARPGHLAGESLVYSAPALSTTIVQEPALAKVGSVVKSIPTAVSHQSLTQVHNSAVHVEDVVAPVVKTSYAAAPVVAAAPVTYAASPVTYGAPLAKTYAASPLAYSAPVVNTYAASPLAYSSPLIKSYAASPVAYSSPLTYAAAAPYSYAATYAAPTHYSSW